MNKKTIKRLKEDYDELSKKYNAIQKVLDDYAFKNHSKESCFDKITKIVWYTK